MNNAFFAGRLSLLKRNGFTPRVIYDIGAYQGLWSREVSELFPEAAFYLFEANEDNYSALKRQSFPFFLALLGNEEKKVPFYCRDTPCTGESIFCEQSPHFQEPQAKKRLVKMTTLAAVASRYHLPPPDLLKIDVQGAEKIILEGAGEIALHAEAIILETKVLEYNLGAPLGHELIAQMASLGYRVADILEFHYLKTGELNEVDYLFLKQGSPLIPRPPFEV